MALFTEKTDRDLQRANYGYQPEHMLSKYVHGLLQALLVHWHLDSDMRKIIVNLWVRRGFDGGVVH